MEETNLQNNIEDPESRKNISEKYFNGRLELLNSVLAARLKVAALRVADYTPGVGILKMGAESIVGKSAEGARLTKAERLQKGLIVFGNSIAGTLQVAGAPAEGLALGSAALEGAEKIEYILQKMEAKADELKEKHPKISSFLSHTAAYLSDEEKKWN